MSLETPTTLEPEASPDAPSIPRSKRGDWTWELVAQFPQQGEWTAEEYLARSFEGLVEFVDGTLEFLPMVTPIHQDIQMFLYHRLLTIITGKTNWKVYPAPLRLIIGPARHREPDLMLVRPEHIPDRQRPAIGADLVIEVVSGDRQDRLRDFVDKRRDYASLSIPEYWIVDPETETITVLTLPAGANEYTEHGVFRAGQTATSELLPEFTVDVTACFKAGNGETNPG